LAILYKTTRDIIVANFTFIILGRTITAMIIEPINIRIEITYKAVTTLLEICVPYLLQSNLYNPKLKPKIAINAIPAINKDFDKIELCFLVTICPCVFIVAS